MADWNTTGVSVDFSELEEFTQKCLKIANTKFPNDTKNFIQRAGNTFKSDVVSNLNSGLKYKDSQRKTGNLIKGYTRGRGSIGYGGYQVRVYAKKPAYHAWLVEHGHALWAHHAKKHDFGRAKYMGKDVSGNHIVGKTANSFEPKFKNMAENFASKFIEEAFR